ncbi:MAG TPA: hypothetical protein VFX50_06040 [Gemmatimonadales bacterium]|nr:hypothetical protein [Gemmatimonadales bacterium]
MRKSILLAAALLLAPALAAAQAPLPPTPTVKGEGMKTTTKPKTTATPAEQPKVAATPAEQPKVAATPATADKSKDAAKHDEHGHDADKKTGQARADEASVTGQAHRADAANEALAKEKDGKAAKDSKSKGKSKGKGKDKPSKE